MITKTVQNDKTNVNVTIDGYLTLPDDNNYRALLFVMDIEFMDLHGSSSDLHMKYI